MSKITVLGAGNMGSASQNSCCPAPAIMFVSRAATSTRPKPHASLDNASAHSAAEAPAVPDVVVAATDHEDAAKSPASSMTWTGKVVIDITNSN